MFNLLIVIGGLKKIQLSNSLTVHERKIRNKYKRSNNWFFSPKIGRMIIDYCMCLDSLTFEGSSLVPFNSV